jgi:hypothetical protein
MCPGIVQIVKLCGNSISNISRVKKLRESEGKKSHYSHQLGFVTLQDKQNGCNAGNNSEDAPKKNQHFSQDSPKRSFSLFFSCNL